MSSVFREGSLVAERYRLTRKLGEGGMGEVWAARHEMTRREVALKFLKGATGEPEIRRFLREARAASAVRHPNVIGIHDVLVFEGLPVMVMDLLEGESLGARLDREGAIPLGDLCRILVPVLSALGTAHARGIVHRDLKPDNIFLSRRPDGTLEPKVLDFGVAKLSALEGEAAKSAALTRTGAMIGTPYYMAPEQAFGEKDLDHRADVWAMGVILFECLVGRRPIEGDNFGQLVRALVTGDLPKIDDAAPHLPADVRALVDRMLVIDKDARSPDLRDAYEVLKKHTDTLATSFAGPSRAASESVPPMEGLADTILDASGASRPAAAMSDSFGRTTTGSSRTGGSRIVIALAAAVVVVAGGTTYLALHRDAPGAGLAPASAPAPSSASGVEVTPVAVPVESAASSTSSASASAPSAARRPGVPGKDATKDKPPAPPTTTSPAAATATATKLPAGMQKDAPF